MLARLVNTDDCFAVRGRSTGQRVKDVDWPLMLVRGPFLTSTVCGDQRLILDVRFENRGTEHAQGRSREAVSPDSKESPHDAERRVTVTSPCCAVPPNSKGCASAPSTARSGTMHEISSRGAQMRAGIDQSNHFIGPYLSLGVPSLALDTAGRAGRGPSPGIGVCRAPLLALLRDCHGVDV